MQFAVQPLVTSALVLQRVKSEGKRERERVSRKRARERERESEREGEGGAQERISVYLRFWTWGQLAVLPWALGLESKA